MYKISEECVACGACMEVCPVNAITAGQPYVIGEACIDCGACAEQCPVNAISPGE